MSGLPQSHFNIAANNVTICPNTSTTLTATVAGALPSGATLTWYSTQFGTTVIGTGANYTTPVLNATATYYVGTCPGTFRVPVTVTVGAGPTISGTLTVPVGGTTQLTGSPTANATTPWTSGNTANGTISSTGLVTGVAVGTTTITYTNSSGCTVTAIVNVVAPLPVELISFTAQANERKTVDLVWVTETQRNNAYFIVERSADLDHWETVSSLQGAGTTMVTMTYSEEDEEPLYGTNYYRLTQADFDGTLKEIGLETVYITGSGSIAIYPNPADDQFHVAGHRIGATEISVLNSLGQLVETGKTVLSDDHLVIDATSLQNGVYYLRTVHNGQVEIKKVNVLHR
jgi:hypothetical protein